MDESVVNFAQWGSLQKRAWKKDYFCSLLPWAQRGAEVLLPFDDVNYKEWSEVTNTPDSVVPGDLTTDGNYLLAPTAGGPAVARIENIENIGAPTINELRRAYRLQEWLENNARGGARYIEQILSHFGVKSSDARLQRPEYLGGGSTNVVISEVLNTAGYVGPEGEGGVQGRMAGHGVGIGRTNSFKRSFEEHGYILGIMSVLPTASYFQGIPRHFSRFDKFDFAFPEFANIGEQEVLNQEIYANWSGTKEEREATLGYTPRYAEYKTGFSRVAGDFRTSLKFWHYGQIYDNPPALNADFIKYNNDNRIFNAIDEDIDNIYVYANNNITAIRPLPYFGTPRT